MKVKELKNLSEAEMETRKNDSKRELFNLRCQNVLGRMENPSRFKTLRREIARIETILKENRSAVSDQKKQASV